jgi:hypothetical protein
MNRDEAKRILRLSPPTDPDRSDSKFAEALELARNDAELARWLEAENALDSAIASQLSSVPPPADLRGKILDRRSVRPIGSAHPAWRRQVFLLVASLVLLASAAVFWTLHPPSDPFAGWQSGSLTELDAMLGGREKFDQESADSSELRDWLRHAHAPSPAQIPKNLQSVSTLGCKTVVFGDNRVSIICFHLNDSQSVHLVTVNEKGLAHPPPESKPQYARKGEWITASWSEHGQSYMLAMKGSEPDLRGILSVNG